MGVAFDHFLSNPSSSFFSDDSSRWRAVVTRDAVADGCFVYAVKTTKIYCRPICKARLARRANVEFFTTGTEAQAAGFRACKRCKPGEAGFMPDDLAVQKIRNFLRQHGDGAGSCIEGDTALSLGDMARRAGLSKWHFHKVFKKCMGVTPSQYLHAQKLTRERSCQMVDGTSPSQHQLSESDLASLEDANWTTELSSEIVSSVAEGGSARSPLSLSLDDFLIWPEETAEERGDETG